MLIKRVSVRINFKQVERLYVAILEGQEMVQFRLNGGGETNQYRVICKSDDTIVVKYKKKARNEVPPARLRILNAEAYKQFLYSNEHCK